MSTPPHAAPAPDSTAAGSTAAGPTAAGPTGLVTLIVGEVGRTGSKSMARSAGNRTVTAKGDEPGDRSSSAKEGNSVSQWSCQWSSDGPGPILPGCHDEPDLTLTIGTDDAYRVKQSELNPSVAFMQGKLKSTGDNALLLSILAWSATPAFTEALAGLAAEQPA
jgi:SCP-2 sterol transfer family